MFLNKYFKMYFLINLKVQLFLNEVEIDYISFIVIIINFIFLNL